MNKRVEQVRPSQEEMLRDIYADATLDYLKSARDILIKIINERESDRLGRKAGLKD